MAVSPATGIAQVNVYRVYVMGEGRRFTGHRTFVCINDENALVWAQQLVDGHSIELWSGTRFVTHFNAAGERSAIRPSVTPWGTALQK
jgi:hypothetical protein